MVSSSKQKKNTLLLNEVISVPARINNPPTVTYKNFQLKLKNAKLRNINTNLIRKNVNVKVCVVCIQ